MKMQGWFAGLLVTGCVVLGYRGVGGCLDSSRDPDEKIAARFAELCEIARDNITTPEHGVRELGRYFGKHTEHLLGELGATMQVIEKIGDDRKHDERARVARNRMQKPLRACERDWDRFANAVNRDPEARALMQTGLDRINRTLEIIFKRGEGQPIDVRQLPQLLEQALAVSEDPS